ncbi:hypothetical protein OGAPHI_000229 [Ogataea philodendri]|uniref:Uncharacterized protein n=1 Tax=Ogataea philodendri TaxID=1378263 RepID=A0A9P8TAX1_9ASCO|nr:uncharacterized protein OGAPHI_000229 [Ogataea philodendri]KAH3671526.1 hypothetical protein OGAPHI_000229 [Ogataea philodendri]
MKCLLRLVCLLLLAAFSSGTVLPLKKARLPDKPSSPRVSEATPKLADVQPDFPNKNIYDQEMSQYSSTLDKLKSSGVLITKETMDINKWNKLGLKKMAQTAKSFDLSGLSGDSAKDPIVLPPDTKALFLFNTQSSVGPSSISTMKLSVPFDINKSYQLVDYSLLLPFKYLSAKKDFGSFITSVRKESNNGLLYYNGDSKLDIKSPVFIMVFAESQKNSKSTLFDIFARGWIKFVGSFDLSHSAFCSVKDMNTNTCTKINQDGRSIDVLPAFANSRLNLNDLFSTNTRIPKRDIDSSLLQPQFRKFATFANFTTLNVNDEDPFKSVKIQVSDPALTSNGLNFKNGSLCNSIDNEGNEVRNSTKLPDAKLSDLYPNAKSPKSFPRGVHYSQVIFPHQNQIDKRLE